MWFVTKTRLLKQFSNKHPRAETGWKSGQLLSPLEPGLCLKNLYGPVQISLIIPGETLYQISREVFNVSERQEMETCEI